MFMVNKDYQWRENPHYFSASSMGKIGLRQDSLLIILNNFYTV